MRWASWPGTPSCRCAYNTFSGQVMYGSTLSARHRELLVLRVAAVRDSEYEWRQHVASAGDNGVDPTRWRASRSDRMRPNGPTSSGRCSGPSTSCWATR